MKAYDPILSFTSAALLKRLQYRGNRFHSVPSPNPHT